MGKVIRRLAAGTVPEQTIFDRRFVAECCETFHLHWRNLRLELTPGNWSQLVDAFNEADRKWRAAGSPPEHSHLELTRFLRSEPAINGTSVGAELCENLYKTAPPEFSRDAEFYEEDEFVHFHYRDLRVEMSVEDFLGFSGVMAEARERLLERPEPLSRLFARLDAHGVLYAVSRNWENLPDAVEVGPHSDLDLIVHPAHLATVEELWHATKTNPQTNPAQRRVPVIGPDGAESFLLVDLRAPGDGYFPEAFAHRALAKRIRNPKGFWTLSPKQHFLALAYHVVHHKGVLTDDYRLKLLAVAAEANVALVADGTEFPQIVQLLAEHNVAFAQADDPWVGPKLPFARPVENAISSRWLLDHAGRPIHSRIYLVDGARGPVVLKQASGDLAKREGDLLGLLDSPRFPKVLDAEARGVDSLLTLEAIAGDPLTRTRPAEAVAFAEGCIEILAELHEAGIVHRDITPHNLLVRDGLPVLIDFGWAVADGLELPPALERDLVACGLGEGGRPPEGGYCDTFAMGVALAPLAAGDPQVRALVSAMTAPAGQRVTDPAGLTAVLHGEVEPPVYEPVLPATPFALLVLADELRTSPGLLDAVAQSDQRVTQLVLYAPDADAEKTAAELGPLFEAPGAAGLDVVLMAVPGSAENEAKLATRVDAVMTTRSIDGPLAQLPRLSPSAQDTEIRAVTPLATERRRVLVAGVYLADKPNTVHEAIASLQSDTHEVVQRWIALGGEPTDETVASVTTEVVTERTPKFALLNRLLETEDLASYDYVLLCDDDVLLPEGFLDGFLPIQERLGFALAGPARTPGSFIDHEITRQVPGALARRTRFVEIGPVVCIARPAFEYLLPFDESNGMGWGFENVWTHRLECFALKLGIVDALPVDHSMRPPVENYSQDAAVADRDAYLAANRHVPIDECMKVLEVFGLDDEQIAA